MTFAALSLRSRLVRLAVGPALGALGCGFDSTVQEEVSFQQAIETPCLDREAAQQLHAGETCQGSYGGELVSIDEGPIEQPSNVFVSPGVPSSTHKSCVYLATCDRGSYPDQYRFGRGFPGGGRPLLAPGGPRLASLQRGLGWG